MKNSSTDPSLHNRQLIGHVHGLELDTGHTSSLDRRNLREYKRKERRVIAVGN